MTYVTRCLSAVGKRPEAPNSHAALVAEWTLALAQAKRGGSELAADCVESIDKLMDGAWASAESVGVASLRGTHYVSSLFDGSIPDVSAFRSFHEGLGEMRNMLKRYKRSFQMLTARTDGAGGSGSGGGGSSMMAPTPAASGTVTPEAVLVAGELSSEQSDSGDSSDEQHDASEAANAWPDKPRFTKGVWPEVRSLFKATFAGHCVWYCTAKCSNGADCDLMHEVPDGFAEFCEQAAGLE